jgi:TRAP-type transport system periplasmic protein
MKKVLLVVTVLFIFVSLILAGCGQTSTPPASSSPPTTNAPTTPAKAIKLTFANWLPDANPMTQAYAQWSKDFETATGGRYHVEMVNNGVLAGIPQAYDAAIKGVADISETVLQDTGLPFPITDVLGLPWSHNPAQVYTKAWLPVIEKGYLNKEFTATHLIMQYPGIGEDFLSDKPVNGTADLNGFKVVIGGGPTKQDVTKNLGAVGVFGGPPDAYAMLQKGIANGIFISAMGLQEFHWDEYVKFMIEPMRMGGVAHTVVMNQDTYNKMPDDVKKILDGLNADGKYSLMAAQGFENAAQGIIKTWYDSGKGKSITWNADEVAKLNKVVAPVWTNWITAQTAKGIPAKEIIDLFYNGLKAQGIANPAVGYTP